MSLEEGATKNAYNSSPTPVWRPDAQDVQVRGLHDDQEQHQGTALPRQGDVAGEANLLKKVKMMHRSYHLVRHPAEIRQVPFVCPKMSEGCRQLKFVDFTGGQQHVESPECPDHHLPMRQLDNKTPGRT